MDYEIKHFMRFEFELDPEILIRYGHGLGYDTTNLAELVASKQLVKAKYDYPNNLLPYPNAINSTFDKLVKDYGIVKHRDDLLYFILNVHEEARDALNYVTEEAEKTSEVEIARRESKKLKNKVEHHFVKDLAGLLLLYSDYEDDGKLMIRIGKGEESGVTFQSKAFTSWIHSLIKAAILTKNYPIADLDKFTSLLPDNNFSKVDKGGLKLAAENNIKAQSSEQKSCISYFVTRIYNFMFEQQILPSKRGKMSSKALRFLHETAILFHWLPEGEQPGSKNKVSKNKVSINEVTAMRRRIERFKAKQVATKLSEI